MEGVDNNFYSLVKQKIILHDFKPLIMQEKKNYRRKYESTTDAKERHKKWAQSEAGKKSMRERCKRYAAAHPDRIKAKQKRQYEKNRDRYCEYSRKYRIENREHVLAIQKAYREKVKNDPEKKARRNEQQRKYYLQRKQKSKENGKAKTN